MNVSTKPSTNASPNAPAANAADPGYWLARWREGRIGFHRSTVQPWLVQASARLLPTGRERVFVPLCGKSVDMAWLAQRRHSVVGVDVAQPALKSFFTENAIPATERTVAPFRVLASANVSLWLGDFFALTEKHIGSFPAIIDRAALCALPPERRAAYAQKLMRFLEPRGTLLLVGLEYDAAAMAGPPFCVPRAEALELFGAACAGELLGEKSLIDEEPHFREKGLTAVTEYALLLRRRRA